MLSIKLTLDKKLFNSPGQCFTQSSELQNSLSNKLSPFTQIHACRWQFKTKYFDERKSVRKRLENFKNNYKKIKALT